MKKIIALMLSVMMILGMFPVISFADSEVYSQDFEKLTTESLSNDGWKLSFRIQGDLVSKPENGLGSVEIVDDPDGEKGKVLKVCDSDVSQYAFAEKKISTIPGSGNAVIEFDMRSSNYGTFFTANDNDRGYDANTNNLSTQFSLVSNKLLYYTAIGNQKSVQNVKTNKWIHYKVDITMGNGTYKIYADGELIAENLPFRWPKGGSESTGYINRIMFGCYQGDGGMTTETYVDNIKITSSKAPTQNEPATTPQTQVTSKPATTTPSVTNTPSTSTPATTPSSPVTGTSVKTFNDIVGHWAKTTIEELATRGVINGVSSTSFAPDASITRAEFVALAARSVGIKEVSYNGAYADVYEADWFSKTVQAAKNAGLIDENMTWEGFSGYSSISREEMTSIVVNAYKAAKNQEAPKQDISSFEDKDSISEWAKGYVEGALGLGIIKGKSETIFDPVSNATRAEAATMIKRLMMKTNGSTVSNQATSNKDTNVPEVDNTLTRDEVLKKIKLVYSSDTTNILSCITDWHPTSDTTLNEDLIKAPLIEAANAGIDVYNMQPGLGWVPWWPSKVYPVEEHLEWFGANVRPNATNPWLKYLVDGNDIIQISLDECRRQGIDFMVSYRLNDEHQKANAMDPAKSRVENVPKFYWENPQYLVGVDPNQASYGKNLQDWQYEEVREYKFELIKEVIENYDLDGLELDFLRSTVLFNTTTTTHEQRDQIMLDFVKRIRAELDKKGGRYRYLAVRIPGHLPQHDAVGVDVKNFKEAGVDIFTLSTYYCMEQETSMNEIKKIVGDDCLVLPELTYTTSFEKNADGDKIERRATDEELNTAAYLAYKNGADGVALFNWQYYRQRVNGFDTPYCEPPFKLLEGFKDESYLAKQPQHYYFATNHRDPKKPYWPLPQTLAEGKSVTWEMDMYAPEGGYTQDGKFRIQGQTSLGDGVYTAKINGVELVATNDTSEPYESPYPQMLAKSEEVRAWIVPKDILKDGHNTIEVTQVSGNTVTFDYVDIGIK